MRVALRATGEAGFRAGRILLGEGSLTALGLYGHEGRRIAGRKVMTIRDLTGFDILVSDDTAVASGLAGIAADDGLSCVLTASQVDEELPERFLAAGRTLLVGADLAHGIAGCLAAHETAKPERGGETTVAWTVPGKPLRRGVAVPFPEPVGPRWGKAPGKRRRGRTTPRAVEVPLPAPWAAATVTVTDAGSGEEVRRVVGVADHADHLAGIALAAGAIAVAEGAYPAGLLRPGDSPGAYLAAALSIGLGVAVYQE